MSGRAPKAGRARSRAFVGFVLVLSACTDHGSAPAEVQHGALQGGLVATVGDTAIPRSLVAQVAAAKHIESRAALDDLIADALAAHGAKAKLLDAKPATAWALRSTLARLVVTRSRDVARAAGLPNDTELAEATEIYWREVNLPEQIRVTHAVVLRKEGDLVADARAKSVAVAIHAAVATSTSADDFDAKAKAVPTDGLEVRVERLPSFVADGRTAEGAESGMILPFVTAAFKLGPGEISGPVETKFGWHVIRAIERLSPKVLSAEARRARFADDIVRVRAKRDIDARLAALRKTEPVELSPAVDALLAEATEPGEP